MSRRSVSHQRLSQLRHPDRERARKAAYYALKSGKIERRPCEVCGSQDVEMHHDDYSRPLEVRFLCRPHHREADRRGATAKTDRVNLRVGASHYREIFRAAKRLGISIGSFVVLQALEAARRINREGAS